MRKELPPFLKSIARFVYYKEQRAKVFREITIRKQQDELINEYDSAAKKVIVFLIMGADWQTGVDKISGGTISIVSLCEETRKLKAIHGAEVLMCTFPNQHLFLKHSQFKNSTTVFRFTQVRNYFKNAESVLLHVPEFLSPHLLHNLKEADKVFLKSRQKVHLNILNQNILLMPSADEIVMLKNFAGQLTITTAHQQYSNIHYRQLYNVPLHKFSVWISPEKYYFKQFEEKQNLIIVSPDSHPRKAEVLLLLQSIPNLIVQVIENLTYEQYKETISNAKWAITFGEGLDGYILEPVFSGAIGFAVYNEDFFTEDFKDLNGIYPGYNLLVKSIKKDMAKLDNAADFKSFQKQQFEVCARSYNYQTYQHNIRLFYEEKYTYP